jgi:O-antigen/teichoic acid export membrane protein
VNSTGGGILVAWPGDARGTVERTRRPARQNRGCSPFAGQGSQEDEGSMSVRKALTFAFLDRYASLVIGIGASMILARLLTPADVAVYSIAAVLLGFFASVRDLGAGQYLVREKELDRERIRAVWTVQLGAGALVACVVAAAGTPVATLYGEPRMRDIMLVLAVGCVINPFGSLTHAWLTRELRYEAIALTRFASTVAGAVVSIALAWQGHGPMSLALGSLAFTVVNAATMLPLRPRFFPWLPGLREVKRVISFGGALTSANLLWTVAKGAPELLLGKLQSLTAAGLYSRASGLVAMFHQFITESIHGVALSWFAKEARERGDFSQSFVKATGYVTAFGWTFCLAIVFLAQPIIYLLFGPQWVGAVDLARLLALAMLFGVSVTLCFAALIAAGAVTRAFFAVAVSTAVIVVLAAAGAWFGLLQVGWASVVASAFDAALFMWLTQEIIGFQWTDLRAALFKSALVACCAAVAPGCTWVAFGDGPDGILPLLAVGVVGGAIGFVGAVFVFRHPIREELRLLWGKVQAVRGA